MKKKDSYYHRILLLFGFFIIFFLVIIIQLINIQVFNCNKYSRLSTVQREFKLITTELRGSFLDRNGQNIRGPKKASFLFVKNNQKTLNSLTKIQPFFSENLIKEYNRNISSMFWIYSKPLNYNQQKLIITIKNPNLSTIEASIGRVPNDLFAWHLLGQSNFSNYFSGLERTYNTILKNSKDSGAVIAIVDASKKQIPGLNLRRKETFNKAAVVLTIDSKIQKTVEKILDKQQFEGAVVILDVSNGEILSMVSRPIINPENIEESLRCPKSPFINRVVSAYYPGSIFKLVLLSAGLDSGILKQNSEFIDHGYFEINNKQISCATSNGIGHGQISLMDAFAYSCNPVFLEIATILKPTTIIEYANKFKLGQTLNIGLSEETAGKIPDKTFMSPGELANLALGQEHITTTPLQIASIIQTIANNGIRVNPSLVKGYINNQGYYILTSKITKEQVLNSNTAQIIQTMMTAVTKYGTGKAAQTSIGSAGKTGTAQTTTFQNTPPHAWFAGYVPINNPKYVGVIFCEAGISGGQSAAPIFKEIMEEINTL